MPLRRGIDSNAAGYVLNLSCAGAPERSGTAEGESRMVTIKDVARRAGVGLGTASRAIAGTGPVSAKAADRVRKAVGLA